MCGHSAESPSQDSTGAFLIQLKIVTNVVTYAPRPDIYRGASFIKGALVERVQKAIPVSRIVNRTVGPTQKRPGVYSEPFVYLAQSHGQCRSKDLCAWMKSSALLAWKRSGRIRGKCREVLVRDFPVVVHFHENHYASDPSDKRGVSHDRFKKLHLPFD